VSYEDILFERVDRVTARVQPVNVTVTRCSIH